MFPVVLFSLSSIAPVSPRLTCEVLVLVVAVVEQTLGTGEAGHALDALPQHVRAVPARAGRVLTLAVQLVAVHAALLQQPALPLPLLLLPAGLAAAAPLVPGPGLALGGGGQAQAGAGRLRGVLQARAGAGAALVDAPGGRQVTLGHGRETSKAKVTDIFSTVCLLKEFRFKFPQCVVCDVIFPYISVSVLHPPFASSL